MKPKCKNCGHQPYLHLKRGCRHQYGVSGEWIEECGCQKYEPED